MELALDDQPTMSEAAVWEKPEQLQALRDVERGRRTLIKRGRTLGQEITRFCEFRNDTLYYYTSQGTRQPKGHYPLAGSVALPSPGLGFSIRLTINTQRDLRIVAKNTNDRRAVLSYVRLASNGELARALEFVKILTVPRPITSPALKPGSPTSKIVPETPVVKFPGFTKPVFLGEEEELVPAKLPHSQIGSRSAFTLPETAEVKEEDSLLMVYSVQSVPRSPTSIAEQRKTGQRLLWNFKLDAAERHFRRLAYVDLRSALHFAEVSLFRVLLTGSRKDVQDGSMALQQAEEPHLQNDEWSEILRAEIGLLRSILMFISGQRLKAFLTLRTSWKLYRKHENLLSSFADQDIASRVSFGLGLFYLILTLIPSSIGTLLRLAGFCGDRVRGLDLLNQCSATLGSRAPMATIVLAVYYIDMDPDLDRADRLLEVGLSQYPSCVLFYWVSSIALWKTGKVAKAISVIQKALAHCGTELAKKAAFLKYELGWFYFLRLNWRESKDLFESILSDCLTLSSELDSFVKEMLSAGHLSKERTADFEDLCCRRFVGKQRSKNSWLENSSMQAVDRVYIPHKACLIIQLAGCFAAVNDPKVIFWLKVTKVAAGNPCASRTKVDEEFGALAEVFLQRDSCTLLPYELVYFLKQAAKLQPDMLAQIYEAADKTAKRASSSRAEGRFPIVEACSARMLQIMALCLMGETIQACALSDSAIKRLGSLPGWATYLRPHTLYWSARAYIAQQRLEDADAVLSEAKKVKNYEFCIKGKLTRLLSDVRARM